jgi:hypothetical protein
LFPYFGNTTSDFHHIEVQLNGQKGVFAYVAARLANWSSFPSMIFSSTIAALVEPVGRVCPFGTKLAATNGLF